MEKLELANTEDTPYLVLDKDNNKFEISGRSLPEDAFGFYAPIHEWLEAYVEDPNSSTELIMNLDYFNSSSARNIVEMLFILEKITESGNEVKVIWLYKEEDDVMKGRGEEIESVVELPFEIKAI
jgi:hypothetical protein